MNTTTAAVGTGALVVVGQWANGKTITVRIVVGVVGLAIFLAILPPPIAGPFAALIVVAALFTYMPAIISKTGLAK